MTEELRTYIDILDHYAAAEVSAPVLLQEDVIMEDKKEILRENLEGMIFKLRSYSEPTGGDFSQGFEQGLEMAAGMLENMLRNIGEQSGS